MSGEEWLCSNGLLDLHHSPNSISGVPTHDVLEVYTASIQRDRDRLALLLTVARTALAQIACKTGERRTSEYAEEALKALDASEGKEPLLSKQLRSGEMVEAKDMEK